MLKDGYFELDYHVNTYNCDENFNLKLSSLTEFLQDIAHWHSDSVGCGYDNMVKMGYAWILYKWKIRLNRLPSLGTVLKIRTWSSGVERIQALRSFRIFDQNGEVIGEALSIWVILDISKRTIAPVSTEITSKYTDLPECVLKNNFTNNPLSMAKNEISSCSHTVKRHDLDYNNHMNNAKYIEILIDSVPHDTLHNKTHYDLEVTYKKECVLGDKLSCVCFDTENAENLENEDDGITIVSIIKQDGIENNRQANVFFKLNVK